MFVHSFSASICVSEHSGSSSSAGCRPGYACFSCDPGWSQTQPDPACSELALVHVWCAGGSQKTLGLEKCEIGKELREQAWVTEPLGSFLGCKKPETPCRLAWLCGTAPMTRGKRGCWKSMFPIFHSGGTETPAVGSLFRKEMR